MILSLETSKLAGAVAVMVPRVPELEIVTLVGLDGVPSNAVRVPGKLAGAVMVPVKEVHCAYSVVFDEKFADAPPA